MSSHHTRSEHRCFGGMQGFYEHDSTLCAGTMRFAVYLPPAALAGKRVPVVYFLAGLTCTEETFVIKAGAQRRAAALGLAVVTCDTSPRAARFAGDDAAWDFGQGAGFYVDATREPWSSAYRMRSYVTRELRTLVEEQFPIANGQRGIFGHSMGGHGALSIALALPGEYLSASAFAPIVAPSRVPWGQKAFTGYLGSDTTQWAEYDTLALLERHSFAGTFRVDQGTADQFLARELKPELLEATCAAAEQPLELRRREGYDHSYYFIASFIDEHLDHHARALGLL
ncbi:MAG: S-formylglutathione hydrolase [Polyangiales bacterium]